MATITLIIGNSGNGKSTAIKYLDPKKTGIINPNWKALPFREAKQFKVANTDDYQEIIKILKLSKADVIVIDDAGYLMTNQFMRGHSSAGAGNGVFSLYNQIGDNFFTLIDVARKLPDNKRVYFIMHEDMNDFGRVKPKSIGKMCDDKLVIEGCFTICLRAVVSDGKYVFRTQTDGADCAKSPEGMFNELEIPNNLKIVDDAICEYYGIGDTKNEATE